MNKLLLAERMHWTLDEVESLDVVTYWKTLARIQAIDKARDWNKPR